jgi:ubiquinone/menaquinone biosynthesis C-methylase UbiE
MVAKARTNASDAALANVEFREGLLEALPIETGWADVVISNGVLNLVPDKAAAIAEMYRVLRPGGRLQAADIVLARHVSAISKQDVSLWTGCIAGGVLKDELMALFTATGFADVEIVPGGDVFAGAPQQSSAVDFGSRGAWIRATCLRHLEAGRQPVDRLHRRRCSQR